jgi:hypothetical protein
MPLVQQQQCHIGRLLLTPLTLRLVFMSSTSSTFSCCACSGGGDAENSRCLCCSAVSGESSCAPLTLVPLLSPTVAAAALTAAAGACLTKKLNLAPQTTGCELPLLLLLLIQLLLLLLLLLLLVTAELAVVLLPSLYTLSAPHSVHKAHAQ